MILDPRLGVVHAGCRCNAGSIDRDPLDALGRADLNRIRTLNGMADPHARVGNGPHLEQDREDQHQPGEYDLQFPEHDHSNLSYSPDASKLLPAGSWRAAYGAVIVDEAGAG